MIFTVKGGGAANVTLDPPCEKDGVLYLNVHMTQESEAIPTPFSVRFSLPVIDTYSVWSPSLRYANFLAANWRKRTTDSRLASFMPLHTLLSSRGQNTVTVAVSDAKTPLSIATGVCEENATFDCDVNFFTVKTAPCKEYHATVRIDLRNIPYEDSIKEAVAWWEEACGYVAAPVPEHARLPMNSLWYSYHQQLDVGDILRECALSKPLGMDTVIVDDGWQTDDNNRGYAYCGDWEVATGKIPDMKAFVDAVHATGMKMMLWYSVPFVGLYSKNYERFKDMMLDGTGNNRDHWSLDPRYPEVRAFLTDTYVHALQAWGLDGFKLDFIDAMRLSGKSLEYDARRDYQSLEDGIDALMTEVTDALRAVNPDVLIEFRQSYVGPAIRKYGNMLRVGDCPNDAILNRQDTVALRLTSGKTAVHSDMLMWNTAEPVEVAAQQITSCLYAVPQISVKIATLPENHRKMLAFYLDFWRSNRDVLLDGELTAANPESAFSQVSAHRDGRAILTAYTDPVIDCRPFGHVIAVNATRHSALLVKGAGGKSYLVRNCMGDVIAQGAVEGDLFEIAVPLSGMVTVS